MDDDILKQSKKENLFYSKELEDLIANNNKIDAVWDLCFNVVLNNKDCMLKYISMSNNKNRIKIKAFVSEENIKDVIRFNPNEIELFYKGDSIKKINMADKSLEKSIKLNKQNNYIITYSIFLN